MIHLPPELWTEITQYNTVSVPPPREFLTSIEPPAALHEYPSIFESVSGKDLLWLHTVSTLSRVDRRLRYMYQGECPRDCLVVTEANIRDVRDRLALLSTSAICVRHLMIVISSPICGHGEDGYAGTARDLYLDLTAIVRYLPRLTIATLSVLNERYGLRAALLNANLHRLSFLEGAQALFPEEELTCLTNGLRQLRVASFYQEYEHIYWRASDNYTRMVRETPEVPFNAGFQVPRRPISYLALPPRAGLMTDYAPQSVERLVVDASSSLRLHDLFIHVGSPKRLTLHNLSYSYWSIYDALIHLRFPALTQLCIITPLPILVQLADQLPLLPTKRLLISIPNRVAGLVTPLVETLAWNRLDRLMKILFAIRDHPERSRIQEIQFSQRGLAERLRQEIATRAGLLATVRESPIRFLDHQGSTLDIPSPTSPTP